MRSSRSDANQAISKSRSRTAKVSGSFIRPSARLMPWPLQQVKSHLLRFRNSPLKNGSSRWEASSWVRSAWFRRRSRSSKKMDHSLWFRAFLTTNRSSPVSRLQPSRAHWKVSFRAAAIELPNGLRINVVSPTVLKESEDRFGRFLPGTIPVEGWKVGQAYKRAILGAQTGRVYKVD